MTTAAVVHSPRALTHCMAASARVMMATPVVDLPAQVRLFNLISLIQVISTASIISYIDYGKE